MQMKKVVGQVAAKEALLKMAAQERLPHALLFQGREGAGGLPLALAFAQFLFCSNKEDSDSCGTCANCRRVAKLEHPDLHFSFPVVPLKNKKAKSKDYLKSFREFVVQTPYGTTYDWLQFIAAENRQGNITAEDCREIIETLNLKSFEGGIKVQIIWRPEYLGKEGNILLKLIEEPPPHTLLILVAEDPEEVLGTLLSRTQRLQLAPLSPNEIAGSLVQRYATDALKAQQIANLANGSFAEALRLLREIGNDLFPQVRNWFNALFTSNAVGISRFAEEWSKKGREQQKNLLEYVIHILEKTVRERYMPSYGGQVSPEQEFIRKLAAQPISVEAFGEMSEHLSKTLYYIERNAHARTLLHALCIKMQHAIRQKQVQNY